MEGLTKLEEVEEDGFYLLHPGEFVLGDTIEWVELSAAIAARLEGKSSLGRLGLIVHATAGFFDPGFQGTGTLELLNVANLPIKLYPGMLIGQFSFQWLDQPCENPYGKERGSKYQGQAEPEPSKYHLNFK